jgi:hypothetical protein
LILRNRETKPASCGATEIWLEFGQNGIRHNSGADGCDGAEESVGADPNGRHEGA